MRTADRRSGFTLIELLVVIAIIALLIGILLPALGEARRSAKLAISISNQKQLGVATQSYAADYQDRLWSFTWRAKEVYKTADPQLSTATTDLQAACNQAVDIFQRRADRPDIKQITGWIPHTYYSHLVIQDYLASRLPEKLVVCPEDRNRLLWQDWKAFEGNVFGSQQPTAGSNNQKRWPYSSSYQIVPAAYDNSPVGSRISQAQHNSFFVPTNSKLGHLKMGDVDYPGNKVHIMEEHQRHFGNRGHPYFALTQARVPLLFFDAAVKIKVTADGNKGWQPNNPASPLPTKYNYAPQSYEPPTTSGGPIDGPVDGYYRWTRGGLRGVDFFGGEINTGQM